MTRLRSPNYPSMSLPEAITKVKQIYEKEYTNNASREVMVKAMGYGGINGASAAAFSALTKYELVENSGKDQYKLSEDALNILLYSRGERARAEAIDRIAFAPQLFAELREQYPTTPPSDDNLNAYLVKKGFNPRWVSDVIRSYRETLEFVSFEGGTSSAQFTQPANIVESERNEVKAIEEKFQPTIREGQILTFKISRDSDVQIRFSGIVTQEAITKLISLLDLSKDVYPTAGELSTANDGSL